MSQFRNLAIVLFEDAEVLDFCGPFEVFSVANRFIANGGFRVFTVAETATPQIARNGLSVNPDYHFANCPEVQILLAPGGMGTRSQLENQAMLDWLGQTAASAELVLSVCTGALLLGKLGLLNNLEVTTHHGAFDLLRSVAPQATVRENRRFVDSGRVVTSGGIAAGIDMSLHVVSRLQGEEIAKATADQMEYPWTPSKSS